MELQARLQKYFEKNPEIANAAYIAHSAELIGDVRVTDMASIWPKCVLRADINYIEVGKGSNLQDGTLVHVADDFPTVIGKYVTIGHGATIHACTIEDECLIGMRAVILDGAVIGARSIIGANALVGKGMIVPPGSLVLGIPGRISRILTKEEQENIVYGAQKYIKLAQAHQNLS